MNGMINKILLSICIPTYNRYDLLSCSLIAVLEASKDYSEQIEVIVSDNCSMDSTENFLQSLILQYPHLRYYRNDSNIGANANFYKLTDEYATGKYCWLLGDDDYVISSTFPYLLKILQETEVDFLRLNFDIENVESLKKSKFQYTDSSDYYHQGTFGQITDIDVHSSNILNTFISSSIFRLEPFKSCQKPPYYMENNWKTFKEVFSHACIHSSVFGQSKNCFFFSGKALSVCAHEKDWDEKLSAIHALFLPQLYSFCLLQGISPEELVNSKRVIMRNCVAFVWRVRSFRDAIWALSFLVRNFMIPIKALFRVK